MGTKVGKELKLSADTKVEKKMEEEDSTKIPQRYGLVNIKNTCYMNAAIQLLRSIPEFNQLIIDFSTSKSQGIDQSLAKLLGNIFKVLGKQDFTPEMFVGMFLQTHQTYLPLGTQHDSDEFMQELLAIISRASPELDKAIKKLFEIEFVEVTKNIDIEEEPKIEISPMTKLCCNVGGTEK